MTSSKPRASALNGESSDVQVLDSGEPLVPLPSRVRVKDSIEPLVNVSLGPGPSLAADDIVTAVAGPSRQCSSDTDASASDSNDDNSGASEVEGGGTSHERTRTISAELREHWSIYKMHQRLGTEEECIKFAEESNLLPKEKMCSYHKQRMSVLRSTGTIGSFQCRKSKCRNRKISRAKNTLFEHLKLKLNVLFQLMYMFCRKSSYEELRVELAREKVEHVVSASTIADWYSSCRKAIVAFENDNGSNAQKLGGPGKIVQLDARKYSRGRRMESHWVLGMVENNSDDLRLEVWPGNNRSADVLVPLVEKHVEKGSEIHTDFWTAYDCLSQHGYSHKKFNKSDKTDKAVAPEGTHTHIIKNQWINLKHTYYKDQPKREFQDWLIEYNWRRKICKEKKDIYNELIKVIAHVYKKNGNKIS